MAKGDVVLVKFPFTDLSGSKLRPAVVLYDGNTDVTVCFITSITSHSFQGDLPIEPSGTNGIHKSSLIRVAKIATIDRKLVAGWIGTLSSADINRLSQTLRDLFQL